MSEWAPLLDPQREEVILITGISGSGKSVALHALEDAGYLDAGYFCVDNLPPQLLRDFIRLEHERFAQRVAVAVDVRTASSLPRLVPLIDQLRSEGVSVRSLFLDASTEALVRRFSETRRPHPLSAAPAGRFGAGADRRDRARTPAAVRSARGLHRDRHQPVAPGATALRPAQLRSWVRSMVGARDSALTLVFESFAFKHGVPLDADYVFDVRVLPNPYYLRELRPLTGRDAPVAAYLEGQPEAREMLHQIEQFLQRWLPAFEDDQRSYLTVAIGCTGGQHRSVYAAEWLARRFEGRHATLLGPPCHTAAPPRARRARVRQPR